MYAAEALAVMEGQKFVSAKGVTISKCCTDSYLEVWQVKFGTQVLLDESLLIEDINLELGRHGLSDV